MSSHVTPPAGNGCEGNAAPYVLGALSDQELVAFRAHLESCSVCREEVAALQVVANALPAAAPQLNAPSELKQRLMSSVEAELPARAGRDRSSARRRLGLPALSLRPALGLAVAAVAVAVVVIALVSGGGGGASTRVIQAQVTAPHASASLRVSGGHAELNIAGMPQTEPNRVYEVWVKRAGAPQPTDALFTVTAKGDATVGVPGSVAGVKEILVTSEPEGGSSAPTRTPVIVANVS
jgi:anti-sigma-K factor RskA